MIKRLAMAAGLLLMLALPILAFGDSASAAPTDANDAAETCRLFDEAGFLDDLGITRGECVNLFKEQTSDHANNLLAAACGADIVQEEAETTNKGQCIKFARST
jgi:hypothetical protein